MPARTRLAQIIARSEGFGKRGAIPTVRHNPGDLEHAPHGTVVQTGTPVAEPDDDTGWADLERQLELYAQRGLNLRQLQQVYCPAGPANPNAEAWLDSILTDEVLRNVYWVRSRAIEALPAGTAMPGIPETAAVAWAATVPASFT
jgi:hypothetical protein